MIENNNDILVSTKREPVFRKRSYGASLFEGRFRLYDKFNFTVKVLDILIISATILLFIAFILGAYVS